MQVLVLATHGRGQERAVATARKSALRTRCGLPAEWLALRKWHSRGRRRQLFRAASQPLPGRRDARRERAQAHCGARHIRPRRQANVCPCHVLLERDEQGGPKRAVRGRAARVAGDAGVGENGCSGRGWAFRPARCAHGCRQRGAGARALPTGPASCALGSAGETCLCPLVRALPAPHRTAPPPTPIPCCARPRAGLRRPGQSCAPL